MAMLSNNLNIKAWLQAHHALRARVRLVPAPRAVAQAWLGDDGGGASDHTPAGAAPNLPDRTALSSLAWTAYSAPCELHRSCTQRADAP